MNFVLDMNVMISAWKGERPDSTEDLTSTVLFAEIIRLCSRLVATVEIDKSYMKKFEALKQGSRQSPQSLNVINVYTQAKIAGKVDISRTTSSLSCLSDESGLDDEDIPFARLASISRSLFVTYEEDMEKFLRTIGVDVASPTEALDRLRSIPKLNESK